MEENVQIWETEAGGLGVQGIFSYIAFISNSKPDRAIRSGKKREKEKIQTAKTIQRKPCLKKKKSTRSTEFSCLEVIWGAAGRTEKWPTVSKLCVNT